MILSLILYQQNLELIWLNKLLNRILKMVSMLISNLIDGYEHLMNHSLRESSGVTSPKRLMSLILIIKTCSKSIKNSISKTKFSPTTLLHSTKAVLYLTKELILRLPREFTLLEKIQKWKLRANPSWKKDVNESEWIFLDEFRKQTLANNNESHLCAFTAIALVINMLNWVANHFEICESYSIDPTMKGIRFIKLLHWICLWASSKLLLYSAKLSVDF